MSLYPKPLIYTSILAILFMCSCHKQQYVSPTQPYNYTFNDDFNADMHNWSFFDQYNKASVTISNGLLNYIYLPKAQGTNTVAIQTGCNVNSSFDIQTSIKTDNTMGIAFGVSNTDYGYSFRVDNNGNFAVFSEGDANNPVTPLVNWQRSNSFTPNAFNAIEFQQSGGYWLGYINNVQVFKIQAQPFYGSKIGFIVESNTYGYADYLSVYWN